MQKIYLLLRNNRQSGPFTLDELLQLQLQPKDLVWVEGRSAGWSYPSEIETLRPFLPATEEVNVTPRPRAEAPKIAAVGKHIFVSMPQGRTTPPVEMPATNLEDKAAAIRRRAMEAADAAALQTNYTRSLDDVEEAYTSWMFKQQVKKKNKIRPAHYAAAAVIVAGLAGGWWLGTAWQDDKTTPLAVQEAIKKPTGDALSKSADPVPLVEQDGNAMKAVAKPQTTSSRPVPKKKKPNEKPGIARQSEAVVEMPQSTAAAPPPVVGETAETEVAAVPPPRSQKKRSLKETIGGFFKKLGGKEASANEDMETRSAQKRDAAPADLSAEVSVKLNRKSEEWMMGVQGMTVTLQNKSDQVLQNAVVEVLYYREDKSLLEKKTVRFGQLAPGKSATLPAPDHRMADHADYNLVSAQARQDAYASQ